MKKDYCKPSFIVVKIQGRSHMLQQSMPEQGMRGTRQSYKTEEETTWE